MHSAIQWPGGVAGDYFSHCSKFRGRGDERKEGMKGVRKEGRKNRRNRTVGRRVGEKKNPSHPVKMMSLNGSFSNPH